MILKTEWRKQLLSKRKSLSLQRRKEASVSLCEQLLLKGPLLSFYSFQSEIDTSLLNTALAAKGHLFLPRVEGDSLIPYQVIDLNQLILSPLGILEPNPSLCPKATPGQFNRVLVPGLGFDRNRQRLGYGKGHYDRFLSQIPHPTIGIGYQEQLIDTLFPTDPWDIPVAELLLV